MGDMNVYLRRSNATTALKSREVNTLKNTTGSVYELIILLYTYIVLQNKIWSSLNSIEYKKLETVNVSILKYWFGHLISESSVSANLEEGNIMWDNFIHPRTLEEIQSWTHHNMDLLKADCVMCNVLVLFVQCIVLDIVELYTDNS